MLTKEYIDKAIELAEAGQPADIPIVDGLSSNKIRRLLHWICKEGTNYLEIGAHKGSTLIPALWGNGHIKASCIDIWTAHWALNNAQRADLEVNLALHLPGREVNIVEVDMFEVGMDLLIPEVDIYFFDGPHTRAGQYQAFVHYDSIFAPRFVALVDDYNNIEVKEETAHAFADLHYRVEAQWTLPGTPPRDMERWWNGLWVAIVNKV